MRNFNSIFLIILTVLLSTGCDDFLTRNPIDQIGEEDFFKNDEEVNKGVIACYNGLIATADLEWALTENRSDNTRHSNGGSNTAGSKNIYQLDAFRVSTTHTWVKSYWETTYKNIKNCNKVLGSLQAVQSEALRNQYEGEARFLRAYHYFNLVRMFGPTFLVTETLGVDESLQFERSSIEETYALILTDLEKTTQLDLLPQEYDNENFGRVNIWAAKTLLAKVYLTQKRFSDARPLLTDVYKNSGYGDPTFSYADIFDTNKKLNKEILFAIRYTPGAYGLGSPFTSYFAPSGNTAHIITGGGDGYNCPTEDLWNSYEQQESGNEVDARRSATFEYDWSQTDNVVVHVAWMKKFFSQVSKKYDGSNDWPLLRFADVVLMLGEVENELSGPSAGLPYINKTRSRGGLRKLDTPDVPTKTSFRLAIEKERRVEFAGENQRLYDLMRTDRALTVLNYHFSIETIRYHNTGEEHLLYMNPVSGTYPDLSMLNNPKIEEWQLFLPVPFAVMAVAPNATQNPGY